MPLMYYILCSTEVSQFHVEGSVAYTKISGKKDFLKKKREKNKKEFVNL
jgi:hypothetical protein